MFIGPTSQTVQQTKNAFKEAIANGQLTKARIDLSVQRILTLKIEMGLIPMPASTAPTATPSPDKRHGDTAAPSPRIGCQIPKCARRNSDATLARDVTRICDLSKEDILRTTGE